MLLEYVAGTQSCNHPQETKHAKVEDSSSWEAASKEHDNTFGSRRKKSLDSLESDFVVLMYYR